MLLRAVAPRRTVVDAIAKTASGLILVDLEDLVVSLADDRHTPCLTTNIPSDQFDRLHQQLQATPHAPDGQPNHYRDTDVIWLSDLTPDQVFLSDSEFDLFITRDPGGK